MASLGFQFKQFFIAHDKCAMKVNTDGILLGALADVRHCQQILDLGTGSGLVAIMLAQRTENAHINALEIEPNAYLQAVENVQNCAWHERIHVLQGDVMAVDFHQKIDLIVSNPPYFLDSLPSRTAQRDLARCALQSHFSWLKQANQWLSPQGKITFILPFDAAEKLAAQSIEIGLYCVERWDIVTKAGQSPKRTVITFMREANTLSLHTLTIYDQHNHYTAEYRQKTAEFYLNF